MGFDAKNLTNLHLLDPFLPEKFSGIREGPKFNSTFQIFYIQFQIYNTLCPVQLIKSSISSHLQKSYPIFRFWLSIHKVFLNAKNRLIGKKLSQARQTQSSRFNELQNHQDWSLFLFFSFLSFSLEPAQNYVIE